MTYLSRWRRMNQYLWQATKTVWLLTLISLGIFAALLGLAVVAGGVMAI